MTIIYKIHPAIGVARVGNSAQYYLAPETPGGIPLDPATGKPIYTGPGVPPQNIFHDAGGAVKKQAARFKIYAYDNANPADLGTLVEIGKTKIGSKTVASIEWTVYLANKKSSWFQFEQLVGSGMDGDGGYLGNNAANPGNKNPNLPYNPIRSNNALGLSDDPSTLENPKRKQLILDPGPRTVSGPNAAPRDFEITPKGLKPFEIKTLGRILTDTNANLLVLGGEGSSGTMDTPIAIGDYANNSGWFDDVSDGSVKATLILNDNSRVAVDLPAWVMCGPPRFAPQALNVVTLFDTMYDVYVRQFALNPQLYSGGAFQTSYQPNFTAEVLPLLGRAAPYQFLAKIPAFGQKQHAALPGETPQQFAAAFAVTRDPSDPNGDGTLMPKLAGDNPWGNFSISKYLTVTPTQYFILSQYADNVFSKAPPAPVGDGVALDRANLENCVGGAFCPGIEITWISRNPTMYAPLPPKPAPSDLFRFRYKDVSNGLTLGNGADNDYSDGLEPGDLSKYMAQPWQADFNECSTESIDGSDFWWWPAQRPYSVFPAKNPATQVPWTRLEANNPGGDEFTDLQMVSFWTTLGFILDVGPAGTPKLVEIERTQPPQAIA